MSYLGIDGSTKCTGVVILSKSGAVMAMQAAKPLRQNSPLLNRIADIESALDEFYLDNSKALAACQQVAIEKPFSGQLWMLHGVLAVQAMRRTGLTPLPILVQTVKTFAGCKTNADKDAIGAAVKDLWGFEHESHDVIDAYILAHIARCFDMPEEYTVYQALFKKAKVY